MAPKSKLILIMAALSLRKKKICALALLVMLDKVENEDTGRRFWVRKIFKERKKYGLYNILRHFCTPIAGRSSSAFPIFSNIVFQVF